MTSYPHAEGELLFLTDSAYLSLIDEQATKPAKSKHDGLFLERLDTFIEGQIRDMAAFADREQHSLDEIRKLVAIPHAKFLFSQNDSANESFSGPSVRSTLARLSSTLQMLHSAAGLDSLLLVVAPHSPATPTTSSATFREASWIGGTELGKDFWMGLKGGGVAGVRTFRAKCRATETKIATSTRPRSCDIKSELNAVVRHALRTASGNPSAEMRWTRPAALEDAYGVRMHGWPAGILRRNPSNNTMGENRKLLECVRSGSMRFVSRGSVEWDDAARELVTGPKRQESCKTDEIGGQDSQGPPTSPVASTHVLPMERNTISSSSPIDAHLLPNTGTALPVVVRTEVVKRSAESENPQDRRTRRRTDSDTG